MRVTIQALTVEDTLDLLHAPFARLEVVLCGAHGRSHLRRLHCKEFCSLLMLAESTVENLITNILGKLEAQDRTRLALLAREHGRV